MKLKTKFQDENFKLGEVIDAFCHGEADRIRVEAYANDNEYGESYNYYYSSIKDFTDHWEDAPEEPKKHYEILGIGVVFERNNDEDDIFRCARQREIGNYFESKEEAEKAVEKLKAFKRLKDIGCRFILDDNFAVKFVGPDVTKIVSVEEGRMLCDDYRLLFGSEE